MSWCEPSQETGLDYFGARYYSGVQGRFTSADRQYFQKEMLADPQRFNLYAYTRNNPLAFTDPSGENIELIGTAEERQRELEAIQNAVGGGAAAKSLTIVEEDGRFYVDAGDLQSFSTISDLAASFASLLSKETEVAQLELASQYQNLGLTDPATGLPRHLSDQRGNGVTGRDSSDQLHIYLDRDCCSPGDVQNFAPAKGFLNKVEFYSNYLGYLAIGLVSDKGTVLGHEAGHAIYMMGHRDSSFERAASDKSALDLENKVRQAKAPGSPVRVVH